MFSTEFTKSKRNCLRVFLGLDDEVVRLLRRAFEGV